MGRRRGQGRRLGAALVALGLLGLLGWACASRRPADAWRTTRADRIAWGGIPEAAALSDADTLPGAAEPTARRLDALRLEDVYRERVVFAGPGIELAQVVLGPGALRPMRSSPAPEAHLVVAGEAEWTVEGETRHVGPGTTIHHAVFSDHRFVALPPSPLLVLRARWAPGGDRTALLATRRERTAGATTGGFFGGERRSRLVLPIDLRVPITRPAFDSVHEAMQTVRDEARSWEPKRPVARAFVDSLGVPWSTPATGVRSRVIFTTPDFEWGELVVEPGEARPVFRSRTPAWVHVLGGGARLRLDHGLVVEVRVGTTLALEAGEGIAIERQKPAEEAGPLRAIWARWAPGGDPDRLARDAFVLEPSPEPAAASRLDPEPRFRPFQGGAPVRDVEADPGPARRRTAS